MTKRIRFGGRYYRLPGSRAARIATGLTLIVAGVLGFLPVLGFWMIPLGLLILSVDLALVRRWRRALELRWERWRRGRTREARRNHRLRNGDGAQPPA